MKYLILLVLLSGCAHEPINYPKSYFSLTLDEALEQAFPKKERYPNPNIDTETPFL